MELMIVIAIIMILAGALTARMSSSGEKAKIAKASAEMEQIASALRAAYADTGAWFYANSWGSDAGLIDSANIKALDDNGNRLSAAELAEVKANWNGPYLVAYSTLPETPWGTEYNIYASAATGGLAVLSSGPNNRWQSGGSWYKGEATGDDIVILVHRFN